MDPHHKHRASGGSEHQSVAATARSLPLETHGTPRLPEATALQAIHAQLQELEHKIAGAIGAVETLAATKTNSEAALARLENVTRAAEQKLREVEFLTTRATQLQNATEALKAELNTSMASVREERAKTQKDLEGLPGLINDQVKEAENRLKKSAAATAHEHAGKLGEMEARLRATAEMAAGAGQSAREAKQLVENAKAAGVEFAKSELKAVQASIEAIQGVKEELAARLRNHEMQTDLKISAFLQKQNAVLENLNQTINAIQRTADALRSELALTKGETGALKEAEKSQKAELQNQIEKLAKEEAKSREELAAKVYDLAIKVRNTDRDLTHLLTQLKNRSWITGVK